MTLSVALRHAFPGFALDVAFTAPDGVTALFGHSGSGKTTVVNAVAGLLRPARCRIAVAGRVLADSDAGLWLPPHRRRLGYVFQDARLFPHLSVRGNLRYGSRLAPGPAPPGAFDDIVALLGIGALLDRRPGALSGGEKARVAIGRALLSRPHLLLMDEPLAALDEPRKAEILPYLEQVRDQAKVPILYVSHSVAEVARLATTVVAMDNGRVVRAGPAAEILSDPDAVPVLGVREAGAVLTGRLVRQHDDGLSEVAVSGGTLLLPRLVASVGVAVRIRIEAQDVILSREKPRGLSALNILAARVRLVRHGAGGGVIVQLDCGDDRLLARITARSAAALNLAPGVDCHAVVKSVSVAPADIGAG